MIKTYTEKYGQPQGNEFVYGNTILRRSLWYTTNPCTSSDFSIVAELTTPEEAYKIYTEWYKENNLSPMWYDNTPINDSSSYCPFCKNQKSKNSWSHARAIVGRDENGQPIFDDSWGKQ